MDWAYFPNTILTLANGGGWGGAVVWRWWSLEECLVVAVAVVDWGGESALL